MVRVLATEVASIVERLRTAKAFLFDMDGVLYRGGEPLPGVSELFAAIERRGQKFILATNNSMASPEEYMDRLAVMGIDVPKDRILTSGTATREYLKQHLPEGASVYVIGMPALKEQIFDRGGFTSIEPSDDGPVPDAVVVGLDLHFSYEKIRLANIALRAGARFVATNADATLPTERGFNPGAGTLIAAIRTASGVEPVVIGKPSPEVLVQGAGLLDATASESVMIGDRLDTDILAGQRAGTLNVLVLTGVSQRADVADGPARPDVIVENLVELRAMLEGEAV